MALFSLAAVFAMLMIAGITVGPGLASIARNEAPMGINTGGHLPLDPDDGRAHIGVKDAHAPYSVTPATSGPHFQMPVVPGLGVSAPAAWGSYDIPLPNEVLIHNLEHGGVGLHYDCPDGCPEVVAALEDIIPDGNPTQFILSPYPGLVASTNQRIAVTAWRHHQYLDEVDTEEILRFIDEYQDRAPESVKGNQFQH